MMKRLLALDGGGIRGLFSLKVLERMERDLRDQPRRDEKLLIAEVTVACMSLDGKPVRLPPEVRANLVQLADQT